MPLHHRLMSNIILKEIAKLTDDEVYRKYRTDVQADVSRTIEEKRLIRKNGGGDAWNRCSNWVTILRIGKEVNTENYNVGDRILVRADLVRKIKEERLKDVFVINNEENIFCGLNYE